MSERSIRTPKVRFKLQRAIHGWIVVDNDGRPVSELTTMEIATKLAEDLNLAAFGGREPLLRALGATP